VADKSGAQIFISLIPMRFTSYRGLVEICFSVIVTAPIRCTFNDEVCSLEEANRENRRIIAALTQRIPELPPAPSQESPGAPESAPEEPDRGRAPVR